MYLSTQSRTQRHTLGAPITASQGIAIGGSVAAPIAGSAVASATGIGALAGPVGAGIGALVGVIAGLWAAHSARVKGAKAENQAINSAVQTFDAGIQAIFAAANSSDPTKNITAAQASQQIQQLYQTFWQMMAPFTRGPGAADTSNGGANCGNGQLNPAGPCAGTLGGHKCDKSCTASCCVGCQDLYPTVLQALQVFANPKGGTVQVCTVYGSGYGAQQRAGYSLTFTPPTVTSVANAVGSDLSSLFGGSSAAGSSSSLMPLLLVGGLGLAAVLALR